MEALGRHLLIELFECNKDILNDEDNVKNVLVETAIVCGTTVLNASSHKFSPQGVSVIVMIAESHLSIHTWPEYNYAACDVFTCGTTINPEKAIDYLVEKLEVKNFTLHEIKRGILKLPKGEKLTHK